MDDITKTLIILVAVVVIFVINKVPVGLVAVGVAVALFATGVLDLGQAFAGFGDPTVVFIAALFIVSEGLDATGVTTWAGQQLIARAGESKPRLLILTMLLVAVLTAFISVNGAVAALLPMVVVMAVRLGQSPSQLLMPLAFGAHAGSMLALTGTPVNVIVSEAAEEVTGSGFNYFEFALAGIPLLIGTILIVVFFGGKLLPNRSARTIAKDLGDHARTLVTQYTLEGVSWMRLGSKSSLVGVVASEADLSGHKGVTIIGVRNKAKGSRPGDPLAAGDLLIVRGDEGAVETFGEVFALTKRKEPKDGNPVDGLITREFGVTEVVIAPRSDMVGEEVFPGMVTDSGDLLILAVQRAGEDLQGTTTLMAGDTLLLQGSWDALDENTTDPAVLVVDAPQLVRRQAVPMGPRAKQALVILAGMVILLATGVVPPAIAGVLAAGAMLLTRVVTVEQAHRSMSWTTLILIGGMIPLSTAIQSTGAADMLAHGLIEIVGDAGPYILVLAISLLTVILGQLISNTATALILVPIAVSIAAEMDISVLPLLMAVTVSAGASFLTPIATPANMMVMVPGGYQFGDYWKLGLPLLILFVLVATFLVPVFWPF